ncbi:MAG: amidohydrolase family protein [Actinomycetota bacterium]|nr:amidohydrolase family protein [Actinomycetota bacterium]
MDEELGGIDRGEVLIESDRIVQVGRDLDARGADVWNYPDMIVMPGFVDAHRHTWQTVVRHCAVGWDLAAYQQNVQGVVGERFTPDDAYVGNLLGALSALDAGITTLRDESHVQNSPEHTDELIRALRDSGIRACFAYGWPSTDAMSWLWDSDRSIPDDISRVRFEVLADDSALVTMHAHLRGPELSTIQVTRADVARARELGLRMSMHMGTGEYGLKYHGIRAIAESGLIGADMTFVHCCTSTERELGLIAAAGASACVTPAVEATMPGLGAPATGRLLQHGVRPALGVDVEVGTPGDMFSIMRAALLSERLRGTLLNESNGPELRAHDLLAFATIDGAVALGLQDTIGSIASGKQADLILLSGDDLNLVPTSDPEGALVAAGHAGNVDTVLVAGRVRKRDGKLIRGDIGEVIERGRQSGDRLLKPDAASAPS